MSDRKKELLKALETNLKEYRSIGEMSVFTAKELNAPMDILRAEITEFGPDLISVLGEFFFIPMEDKTLLFSTVISLSFTVPPEAAPDVASAIARLNFILPCGCYALGDKDKTLIYRHSLALREDDDKKSQNAAVSLCVDMAMGVAEKYYGNLLLILNNEMSVNEMMDIMLKPAE